MAADTPRLDNGPDIDALAAEPGVNDSTAGPDAGAAEVEPDILSPLDVPDAPDSSTVADTSDAPPQPVFLCPGVVLPEGDGLSTVPALVAPVVATIEGAPLTVRGTGLGAAALDRGLVFVSGDTCVVVPSVVPGITNWSDTGATLTVPEGVASGTVQVFGAGTVGLPVPFELYGYDWVDIPETPGTNASPLDLVVDDAGRVWINQEFHLDFQRYDPAVGAVVGLQIPKPPAPGPFATLIFSDHRTQMSVLGESVILDPQGRVWFTEGGASLYQGAHPNHSRVVRYDPEAAPEDAWRVYNMPGDGNEVIGVAWDPVRQRVWVAEGGLASGAKLTSFDPEAAPWDNHFDFSTSLDDAVCGDDDPDDAPCFRTYTHPVPTAHVAHLRVAADGAIWFTAFWGDHVGRLFPETGIWEIYPVPSASNKEGPAAVVGSGPWQLRIDDATGDVVFCEFFDSTVNRLPANLHGAPECLALDASGVNPCIQVMEIPDHDPLDDHIHSIDYDATGRLWYTTFVGKEAAHIGGSLGFVTADWSHIVRLPSLEPFPGDATSGNGGVAIDHATGDIWFTEFWRKRIGRLARLEP